MKKILIPIFLLIILFGCFETDESSYYWSGEPAKYMDVSPGGCAVDGHDSEKSALFPFPSDTVTHNIVEEELILSVGFKENCCSDYATSSVIRNDTILINIVDTSSVFCLCLCYYNYEFKYTNVSHNYKCIIKLDDHLFYDGLIEP